MTRWRIHYEGNVIVEGETKEEWLAAPQWGVQVVVLMREPCHPCPDGRSERVWAGVTDRVLYTGVDDYDPLGYGVKYGTLIDTDDYMEIWEDAKWRPLI